LSDNQEKINDYGSNFSELEIRKGGIYHEDTKERLVTEEIEMLKVVLYLVSRKS
jgi:hypothetical protein